MARAEHSQRLTCEYCRLGRENQTPSIERTVDRTYDDWRTLVETISICSIKEAGRMRRIVDAAVPRVCEIEGSIGEPRLAASDTH